LGQTTPSSTVFNPVPTTQAGAVVNKLSTVKQANPAVVAAMTTPAPSNPTSAPTTPAPTTPTPTSTAPTSDVSKSAPTPVAAGTSAPSTGTTSAASQFVCVTPMAAGKTGLETLWHLDATSLTLYMLVYKGVITINTPAGPVNVLDFHADSADVVSMVTYSANPKTGKNDYANGGQGKTVHLTNVEFHVLQQTGNLGGLIPVTLAPGNLITNLLGITQGIPIPIPEYFSGVHVDQYLMTADTLSIPGFHATQDQ
jgi:hypothetical protein